MNNEQKQQAKHLYFQTNLSKTEIANYLNVSRRSVHYWIKEGNWERLKRSAEHMPAMLAENCYHIFSHLSEHLLSERRVMKPVTYQEANTLHKLTITIKNLKNRQTVNESMEMFAYFLDGLNKKSPGLAQQLMPHVEEYLSERTGIYPQHFLPDGFNEMGYLEERTEDPREAKLDMQDIMDWTSPVRTFDGEQPDTTPAAPSTPAESPRQPAGPSPLAQPQTVNQTGSPAPANAAPGMQPNKPAHNDIPPVHSSANARSSEPSSARRQAGEQPSITSSANTPVPNLKFRETSAQKMRNFLHRNH